MTRLSESEIVVSKLIYERLGLLPSTPRNFTGNPLSSWDLTCSVDALSLIASQQNGHLQKGGWQILAGNKSREIHEQLLTAFPVFEDWPANFHNFLDQLRSLNTKTGVVANLGSFYYRLRRLPQSTLVAQILGKEFENYLVRRWDRGYLKKIRCIGTDGKYIPMTTASRFLHMHFYLLQRLVSEGKLKAVIKKTGRTRLFLVEMAGVERLKRERARYLSLERASRLLGLCQFNLLRLVEHSLIVPTESPAWDVHSTWKFDKDLLSGFLDKLFSKTKCSRLKDHRELQPFSRVLALLNRKLSSSCAIQILIEDILRGKLVPRKRLADKTGIGGLSFSRQEVKAYVDAKFRVKTIKNLQPAVNFKALGLTPQVVSFLVDKGLIKTNGVSRKKGRARIARDSILLFLSEFIFAKEAARASGTSVGFLIHALRAVGITPVSGKKIDFGPQYVFRKADLNQVNLAKLIERTPKSHINKRSDLISSAEAAEILSITEETVLELVKNDVLKPSRPGNSEQHLFYRPHVERYQGQFENIDEMVSTKIAADLLEMTRPMLYHSWIRSGYLTCEVVGNGRKRFLRKSEIEKVSSFLKSVVGSTQAATLLGVPYTYVRRWEAKKLLKSVRHPYPRALRRIMFSKAELAKLRVSHKPIGSQQKTLLRVDPSS